MTATLTFTLVTGIAGAGPLAPGIARAQQNEPSDQDLQKAREAYMAGAELVEQEKYAGAVDEFKKSYRLSRNPLLLYNIGWAHDESGDAEMALFYYEKFLSDAPEEAEQREFVTERVAELQRQVEADEASSSDGRDQAAGERDEPAGKRDEAGKAGTSAEAGDAETAARGDDAAPITGLQHKIVHESPPDKPLDVTAFIPDGADWQVTLYYRGAGEAEFVSTGMRPRYNELVGRIPAERMQGISVQYYVEAKDKSGNVIERSGRATSPHLVLIDETAAPKYYPDFVERRDHRPEDDATTVTPRPGNGWMDVESSRYQYAKWGTTGTAAGMLTLSVSFYLLAANASSSLEGEAAASVDSDECPSGPPCRTFSDHQKDLQAKGERYETLANVSLGVGVLAAGAASYLWYREIKNLDQDDSTTAAKSSSTTESVTAVPVVERDYVGAAATISF